MYSVGAMAMPLVSSRPSLSPFFAASLDSRLAVYGLPSARFWPQR